MKTYITPQDSSLIPTLGVTLWLGWNGILSYLTLYAIFFASNLHRIIIISIYTISFALPKEFPKHRGEKIGNWIMLQATKYFGLTCIVEDEEGLEKLNQKNKPVIIAMEPHDILPYGVFALNPSLNMLPGKIGETCKVLMTGSIFNIPIMKHVYTWVGGDSVDKETFRRRLGEGQTVAFCPGGVQEVILMDPAKPEELVLYLNSRKGFIKLALERGVPIVPSFIFGLDKSFGYVLPRGKIASALARKIGFLPVFFWGRFFIPMGIPNPAKIDVIFGEAIDVPEKGINITKELVEEYHKIFVQKMEELFERHKHASGYGHRTLKIV